MKIGIFGGTFDPPHLGHKKYAAEFIGRLGLDRLIVIPTFIPPHKQHSGAGSAERLEMTRLAFADLERAEVSGMEIMRGGTSYTCDTVRILADKYPQDELIFLIGSDMLLSFHRWKKTEEILKYTKICAVARSGGTDAKKMRKYVNECFPDKAERFIICSFQPLELSSTDIRRMLRDGQSVSSVIDGRVAKYIKDKELYL